MIKMKNNQEKEICGLLQLPQQGQKQYFQEDAQLRPNQWNQCD